MISTKPYLLRAIYEWCVDQGFTPYLQVVVNANTRVPREYVRDGQIVLNIGPEATHQLQIGNEDVTFQARFNGQVFPIFVPVEAVGAIYARENGQGMAFELEPESAAAMPNVEASAQPASDEPSAKADHPPEPPPDRPAGGRSHLTRVK